VTALSVDENEHLVRAEPAQCGRADVIGSVSDRWTRKIERGREELDDLARLDLSGLPDFRCRENVDGHWRL
jgi:hypothetical protein